jgi:hypothetical protein
MQDILELVEKRKQEFAQLPLFQYLQDSSLSPEQRLVWTPFLAPLALGFGDLWKDILRREPTENPLQILINRHTREDENHWKWYISDIRQLGFLAHMDFSDSLAFLWNEKTPKTRQVCLKVAGLTYTAEPIVLLAAIEALEATANVVFSLTSQVVQDLPLDQQRGLRYFSHLHLDEDNSHAIFDEDRHIVNDLTLTPHQKEQAIYVVEAIFQSFNEAFQEIMQYVEAQSIYRLQIPAYR